MILFSGSEARHAEGEPHFKSQGTKHNAKNTVLSLHLGSFPAIFLLIIRDQANDNSRRYQRQLKTERDLERQGY